MNEKAPCELHLYQSQSMKALETLYFQTSNLKREIIQRDQCIKEFVRLASP